MSTEKLNDILAGQGRIETKLDASAMRGSGHH
jgi:hypothetical protein